MENSADCDVEVNLVSTVRYLTLLVQGPTRKLITFIS